MAIVNGTNGGDTLYGTGASDQINGLNGNDSLKGFGGADRLDGGAGVDTVFYGDSTVGVGINLATGRGFGGTAEGDTLISIENVFGSNFNDTITGTSGANQLHGGEGNDVIKGGGGNDFLDGGNGNDILQSDIFGRSVLDGGTGDDTFKGSGHADTLIGGTGSDTVDFSHKSFVTISLGDPLPYWAGLETPHAQFISIENLTGSPGQDILVGNGATNVLRGLGGEDNLIGGGGADIMYGGTESDHYYVDTAGDVVREYAGEGTFDVVWTTTSYALTPGSEIEQFNVEDLYGTAAINLTGNEFGNIFNGNYGDNIIDGGGGADIMRGWKGNDTYIVDNPGDDVFENGDVYSTPENESEGFDTLLTTVTYDVGLSSEIEVIAALDPASTANIDLVGSLDNNTIIGNNGQNTIVGSYGKDTLTGNGGGDVFVWSAVEEIGLFNFDPDIVTDFDQPAGDLLAFNPIDADETVAGDQAFTFIDTAPFTAPGQISWFTNGADTFIQLNTNADLTVDGVIQVFGVHTVDASWFVL
jgi:Ca2+-binding RTX toxin-like protein